MPGTREEADADLTEAEVRRITETHARLPDLDHYALLGVPRDADKKAVKRAFYDRAAEFHTDRFFRKRLGAMKPMMEAIFGRVVEAYETLRSADSRAKYDATLGAAAEAPAALPPPVDPAAAARQRQAMEALKQRYAQRHAEAAKHVAVAARARANGDLEGAVAAYRAALAITPNDLPTKAAYEEVRLQADVRAADGYARQGTMEERFGQWAEAARSWERVARARPDDANAHERTANAMLHAGKDADDAYRFAARAAALAPASAAARATFGRVLAAAGRAAESVAELEAATRLAPAEPAIRDMLARARRGEAP